MILVFSLPALTNSIVLWFWQRGAAAVALTELFSRRRIPIKDHLHAVCRRRRNRSAARSGCKPAKVKHSGEPRNRSGGRSEPGTRKRPVVLCNSQVMGNKGKSRGGVEDSEVFSSNSSTTLFGFPLSSSLKGIRAGVG